MAESKYAELGVDANKGMVREIFKAINRNEYPGAFVNMVTCPWDESYVMSQHPDGDGSKMVQRFLHYEETGDPTVFRGAVDDALSMNTGDVAAAGLVFGWWFLSEVKNVNSKRIPKKVFLEQLAIRLQELMDVYRKYGLDIFVMGGETADLPDQVRSAVYDMTLSAVSKKAGVIKGNIQPGDLIYGFASDGQADWEDEPNSGIMSNGLTLARTFLMHQAYSAKYPWLVQEGGVYRGAHLFDDQIFSLGSLTVGEAIISPTRQWAILIRILLAKLLKAGLLEEIHGISMNTGGGATKIGHVGTGGILYHKEMPVPPLIFKLVQEASGETWEEMYRGMNCGVGLDIVVANGLRQRRVEAIINETSDKLNIECFKLGECKSLNDPKGKNRISLKTPYGDFDY